MSDKPILDYTEMFFNLKEKLRIYLKNEADSYKLVDELKRVNDENRYLKERDRLIDEYLLKTNEKYESLKKTCEEKISELELENKFLTEKIKELIKSLADCLDKKELNKNIEHIEWYPVSIRPTKEEYYLARATTSMHNETIYCGSKYNFSAGWCGLAPFTVTHWAKVEGPKL